MLCTSSILDNVLSLLANYSGELIASLIFGLLALLCKPIVAILKNIPKAWRAARRPPDIRAVLSNGQSVRDVLTELRVKHGATRALLFKLHNGERFASGSSIMKMSCVGESLSEGVSSLSDSCRNVMLSTVPEAIQFIYDAHPQNGKHVADTSWHAIVRDDLPGGSLRATFKGFNVAVAMHRIAYSLKDRNDPAPIGFVALQFDDIASVRCNPRCLKDPCAEFNSREKLGSNSDMSLCSEWESSSLDSVSLIERLIHDPALQYSWYHRFLGTLQGREG